jgi:hypothetical protein
VAPTECDGAGSSHIGLADHGEGPVFRSMLALGERLGIAFECAPDRSEGRWSGVMKAT